MSQTKKRTLILILVIILIAIPFISYGAWVKYGSKPLDDEGKLTYVGRRESGCWYILCIDKQVDEFYYATDMSLDEITNIYFSKATVVAGPSETAYAGSGVRFLAMTFENVNTQERFGLTYYINSQKAANYYSLDLKGNKNLVLITDRPDYNIAKKSL